MYILVKPYFYVTVTRSERNNLKEDLYPGFSRQQAGPIGPLFLGPDETERHNGRGR